MFVVFSFLFDVNYSSLLHNRATFLLMYLGIFMYVESCDAPPLRRYSQTHLPSRMYLPIKW